MLWQREVQKVEGKGRHEVFPGSRRKALALVNEGFLAERPVTPPLTALRAGQQVLLHCGTVPDPPVLEGPRRGGFSGPSALG